MARTHIIRNSIIAGISLFGFSALYRTRIQRNGPLVRVLVFHDVQDSEWFRKVISYIDTHYHVVSPEDFIASRFDTVRINVLITFDDGYASWVTVCLPMLSERSIRALFFINSGLIDSAENTEVSARYVREQLLLASPRTILSWDGVQQLEKAGHTIGGHTVTHERLSSLQKDMQCREIRGDKQRIESVIGKTITTFAYPFGQRTDYTEATKLCVFDALYTHAFTTESNFANTYDLLTIPRLCIEDNVSVSRLRYWIEGGYDLYSRMKKLCVR
jgi:peptidoglycan/xylan/chitin deacetylase (PgdA/CDA1 family)